MAPRASLRVLLALALPMVVARASQSVMTFADALQSKHLGPAAIAASATGGLNVYLFTTLFTGTVFIVQSFVSQHVGRGERDLTPRYAWYGFALALIAQIVAFAGLPVIAPALRAIGYDVAVAEPMTDYMQIRMLSVFGIVGIEVLGNWYGGLGNTWLQMIAGITEMLLNFFLNWLLIDGHWGAPAMGVAGSALASTIATWTGFAMMAFAFWRRWGMAIGGPAPRRDLPLALSWKELRRVVRFGLPNGANWFAEFAAFQIFVNVVFGGFGAQTLAAFNVVLAINSIAFMPAFGLASAGAILAGQAIGAQQHDRVWPSVRLTLKCNLVWMGLLAAVYLLAPHALLGLFESSSTTSEFVSTGATLLVISAAWQLFDATGITLSETLRAAGDTTWTAIARLLIAWVVFMPAALIAVKVFGASANGAMACLLGYLLLLSIALAYRFKSGKWKSIELIEPKLV